jgi:hypothetical protein
MRLPSSYSQVTIEEYQTIYPHLQGEIDWSRIISFFTGKTYEWKETQDLKFYKYMVKTLSFLTQPIQPKLSFKSYACGLLKSVKYKPQPKLITYQSGNFYKASRSVNDINTARYITIKTLMEQPDYFPNKLHELCALTYEPASYLSFNYDGNKHTEIAEKFLKAPMSIAQPSVFFCLEVLANWNLNTLDYLESEKMMTSHLKEIETELREKGLSIFGDGFT